VYPDAGSIAVIDLAYTTFANGVFGSITLGVDASSSNGTIR
jgi:hypothetical protein